MFVRRLLVLLTAVTLTCVLPGPVAAIPRYPYSWPDYSLVPVFFVPTDWSVNDDEVRSEAAALRHALAEIRAFYGAQNSGWAFSLNELEVVQARGPKERYHIIWNGRNIYEDGVEFDGNMEHEVVSELHARGFPTPVAQDEDGYSVLIFVKGAGGWAGGREFLFADGGWAILGDWTIDSIEGELDEDDYWWSGRRRQTGAAAHELGHTFDLPHPEAHGAPFDSSIMGAWWSFPGAGLSDWERDHIATVKAPFFRDRLRLPTEELTIRASEISGSPDGGPVEARIRSGSAASLHANDTRRLVVGAVPREEGFEASVYVRFAGVPNALAGFNVVGRDRATRPLSRSVEVWNEQFGWVALDIASAAKREVPFHASSPAGPPTLYVAGISGPGDVWVRLRFAGPHRFTAFVDELRLDVSILSPSTAEH